MNQRINQETGQEMKSHRFEILPDGLTEQARMKRERYFASCEQRFEQILLSISLNVLVWGPDPTLETRAAQKRVQIHAVLQEIGHNAMMSEEIPFGNGASNNTQGKQGRQGRKGKRGGQSKQLANPSLLSGITKYMSVDEYALKLREMIQAREADFIVVLVDEEARGVIVELDICGERHIASKVCVLLPKKIERTFTYKASLELIEGGNGSIYKYADEELESCNVLTEALRRVEARRMSIAYAQERRKRAM